MNAARRMEIEWSFNPPTASHQGGVWERMIRMSRSDVIGVISLQLRSFFRSITCCTDLAVTPLAGVFCLAVAVC